MKFTRLLSAIVAATAVAVGACAPSETASTDTAYVKPGKITVYSGRNEKLILPLIDRFRNETGIEVAVRYGDTAELAATILEEGPNTPAAVFISQDAGALGALADANVLKTLPADVIERVPARHRSPAGVWVGLSGRARTIVYNTGNVDPSTLPRTLEDVGVSRYRGRFGLAPTNSSLQAHLAVHRVIEGEAATRAMLKNIAANDPRRYPNNSAIVDAVIAGEIDFGLVNHYYLWQARKERPGAPAENFFMPDGRASSFINLAGVGVLRNDEAALSLVRFLLSDESQAYFANETYEYPVVAGIAPPVDLPPLESIVTPEVDFGRVSAELPATLEMIRDSGLIR
jgi:iron(III) transport system substrate-binding protein